MNRGLIEQEVARVFRATSLRGNDGEIRLSEPLGDLGLGLDSLALLEFVTALEQAFQAPMPDDIWTGRGQLTLNDFVEMVAQSAAKLPAAPGDTGAAQVAAQDEPEPSRTADGPLRHRAVTPHARRGLVGSLSRKLQGFSHRYYIVEFKLSGQPLPVYASHLKLSLRSASLDDSKALTAFWKSFPLLTLNKEPMNLGLFERLLASGHRCYAAWLDDEIVGWDWIWERGFTCRYTGLRLDWPRDTCYAGELRECHAYRGNGVGLALLAFSLTEAEKRGYARQVCWVDSRNRKMLSGAIQLFGFELTGQVRRTGRFPLSMSNWRYRGRAGFGRALTL